VIRYAAHQVVIRRHANVLEISIDDQLLPRLYVADLVVRDAADVDLPSVTITLYADRILMDAANYEPPEQGVDDGETDIQGTPQATQDGVRLPGTEEVPHP
jgi:hypothetical protein